MTEMEKRSYMKKYREKVKKMNCAQLAEEWARVTGILKPGGPETEEEEEQESGGRLIERKGSAWRLNHEGDSAEDLWSAREAEGL